MCNQLSARSSFFAGLKSGTPVAIGYLPVAITFGLLAQNAGYGGLPAVAMSLIVYAGASQFVAINLLSLGVTPFGLVVTTLLLNFRHFIMSASLSQRLKSASTGLTALAAFGVTDETYAVAMFSQQKQLGVWYVLGLNLTAYLSWVGGTALGCVAGGFIPDYIAAGLSFSLYAMFVGLLTPNLKGSPRLCVVALIAAAISCLLTFAALSKGLVVIVSTLSAAIAGAVFFPEREEVSQP